MRVVLLFSGGLDSSTFLAEFIARGDDVTPLFIAYGQRHSERERAAAYSIARALKARWSELYIGQLGQAFAGNALTGDVPLPTAAEEMAAKTVVPGRNLVLIALANVMAERQRADAIAVGCNGDDAEVYPDCRAQFLADLAVAIGKPILSLTDRTKVEIAQSAARLGLPIDQTWSCYGGGATQCGRCDACVRRAHALDAIDVPPFASRVDG